MSQPNDDLVPRPCSDIPELQRFTQEAWRKQMLLDQTGGGEAFVEAAARSIRKNVLQALPYMSPSSKYVSELRRAGVADRTLDRALARAWLDSTDHFMVPRARKREFFRGTFALLAYAAVAAILGLLGLVRYLRHAHPEVASALLALPPLLALVGVPLLIVVFLVLRKAVHRR